MIQSYTVIIEKRHCEGADYLSNFDCPLCAAIREQLPEFKLKSIAGTYVRDIHENTYSFNHELGTGWECIMKKRIESGEVQSHEVTFYREIESAQPQYHDITKSLAVLPVQETTDTKTDDSINEEIPEDYYLKY